MALLNKYYLIITFNFIIAITITFNSGIIHAINETESESIFTSYDLLDRVLNLSSKCPTLNTVIYVESKVKSHRNFITNNNKIPNKLRLISFSKLTEDGMSFIGELKLDPFDFNDVSLSYDRVFKEQCAIRGKKAKNSTCS